MISWWREKGYEEDAHHITREPIARGGRGSSSSHRDGGRVSRMESVV